MVLSREDRWVRNYINALVWGSGPSRGSILVLDFFVFPIILLLLSFQFSNPYFPATRFPFVNLNFKILKISQFLF